MSLAQHLPALQVVLPLISAPLSVLLRRGGIAFVLVTAAAWASFAIAIASDKADDLARALRACRVPVCPRIHDRAVYLDMRTVSEDECALVAESFREMRGDTP